MLTTFVRKLFGSANDRIIKKMDKTVRAIGALEATFAALSDAQLQDKTNEFRHRLAAGETLDDLLVEAFATVREASKRVLKMRPFDVQLVGGIILHRGMIPEMRTGEGKTLVSTLPAYLNALSGEGVHIVTVNDYLATRDSTTMAKLHNFLGLSVGRITHDVSDPDRRKAYACDITYATNNELGFDYLRDNMKFSFDEMVQRPFNFAIVDEVDSILIDEARTPLIISGPAESSSDLYSSVNKLIPLLVPEDYEKDEKSRSVLLTEGGTEHVEELLSQAGLINSPNLYDASNSMLVHHVNQALRAHKLFSRDTDYIVKDNKVIIIDEFTGRMMDGRRYSEGLHQALEAKENVKIQVENQTLASITFQNYFRLYKKLSGMTGTALTEATEFGDIYKLEVVDVPTNVPCVRKDEDDEVYRTAREKFEAIVTLIKECQDRQQPVLVGTVSIEKSEMLSELLQKNNITHKVLNARYHEQEALIIAQAGFPGAVTIATNMAGRGTDIQLGGNFDMRMELEVAKNPALAEDSKAYKAIEEQVRKEIRVAAEIVRKAGGLYVIGTERHESRRIDNQLRGRAGRQGDPGASKFFLSLEDDLMRIFGSDRLDGMLKRLGLQEGEAIAHAWINKALMRAQRKVEARNYDIRKQLLKFDDVMNDQRKVVYEQRKQIMAGQALNESVVEMRHEVIERLVDRFTPEETDHEQWDIKTLHQECIRILALDLPLAKWIEEEDLSTIALRDRLIEASNNHMNDLMQTHGAQAIHHAQQSLMLQHLDHAWKDHLLTLDHLRQGINLRAYGQKDPLNEYKHEAFNLFNDMMDVLRESITASLSHAQFNQQREEQEQPPFSFEEGMTPELMEQLQQFLGMSMSPEEAEKFSESLRDRLNQDTSDFEEDLERPATPRQLIPTPAASKKKAPAKKVATKAATKETAGDSKAKAAPKKAAAAKTPAKAAASPAKVAKAAKKPTAAIQPPEGMELRRNDPCHCGSGFKYKHCHGRI
jgi:preprotein translocase subunit SecA